LHPHFEAKIIISMHKEVVFIDTHTHLYSHAFDSDREEMIRRALDSGVKYLLLPNVDAASIASMIELEESWPGNCFAMMGLHPCSVGEDNEEALKSVNEWLHKRKFIAVGEIGIDLYWEKKWLSQQIEAFEVQCQWAAEYELPVVIHARDSIDILIDLVAKQSPASRKGVFHCFTGTEEQAVKIVELGYYLGIGGVVTYKSSDLRQVLKSVPVDRILLETDSPYLAPVPYRGKRNESAYLINIARQVAEVYGVNLDEIASLTTRNAVDLFKLPID
jgi:TatD DNase family protein